MALAKWDMARPPVDLGAAVNAVYRVSKIVMAKTMPPQAAARVLAWIILAVAAPPAQAEKLFYRYTNEQGVKVLNHTIPPDYVQKGYEVVTASGEVVKVVKPSVSREEAERLEQQRLAEEARAQWDDSLRRRYSSVLDIEAAKKRKLSQLDANMSLLRSNISGLRSELAVQQSRAADLERAGRNIPEALLTNIRNLKLELENTETQVLQRREEYGEVAARYDRDIARFREIATN